VGGEADASAPSPELIALFSGSGHDRTLMVSGIESADGPATLDGMTSEWTERPSTVRNYRWFVAGPGLIQVAWAEPELVVWVAATGLFPDEVEVFVEGVSSS
jgi:hypothetical protein